MFFKASIVVSMETSVADDFYSSEGFQNFLSYKILSIASENLSCFPRKASNIYGAYAAVIVANYGMPMPCIICMHSWTKLWEFM